MSWPPNDLPQTIRNRTFDEIAMGKTASIDRTLTLDDIQLFALMSGDMNPRQTSSNSWVTPAAPSL